MQVAVRSQGQRSAWYRCACVNVSRHFNLLQGVRINTEIMKSAKSLKDKFVFTIGFVLFLLIIKLKTELKKLVAGGIFPQSDKSQSLRSRTHVM